MLRIPPWHPTQLPLGLVIWAGWFVFVYGGLSVGCALTSPDPNAGPLTPINGLLGLVTLGVTLFLLALARYCWRGAHDPAAGEKAFIARLAGGGHVIAAIATLATGFPILVLPPCV